MKKFFIAVTICVLAGVGLFFFLQSKQPAPSGENPSVGDTSGNPATTSTAANRNATGSNSVSGAPSSVAVPGQIAIPPLGQPQDLSARAGEYIPPATATTDNTPPDTALQNVRRVVRQYGDLFGGNPVGTNPEITSALTGNNPRKMNFVAGQEGMQVNGNGELVDTWGTPYFFHQLSATDMEIHSAGPDKKMWTSDDLVTR